MDKVLIFYIWFLTIVFASFYGFEFGIMRGEHETRAEISYKLTNCNKIIGKIND